MKPEIINLKAMTLCGFTFYGDPFSQHSAWTEENEIGQLWKRLRRFAGENPELAGHLTDKACGFEAHILDSQTMETGCYEVFAGYEAVNTTFISERLLYKTLPENMYAVFSLDFSAVNEDVFLDMTGKWLPENGLKQCGAYSLNRYSGDLFAGSGGECTSFDVLIPVIKKA